MKRQTAGSETAVMQSKSRGFATTVVYCASDGTGTTQQKTVSGVTSRQFSVLARCESPLGA